MTPNIERIANATDLTMKLLATYKESIMHSEMEFRQKMQNANLTMEFGNEVANMSDKDIDAITILDVKELLNRTNCDPTALMNGFYNYNDKSGTYLDYCKMIFKNLKTDINEINDSKYQCEELEENQEDLIDSMTEFLDRPENKALDAEKIQQLKSSIKDIADDAEKKLLSEKIENLENASNFNFLITRLEKIGKKEAESILKAFFKDQQGGYVLTKYRNALKRIGVNTLIHTSLFNLEEILLPEYYWAFNNFFLFHVMRYIAYADVKSSVDQLYISSILTTMRACATQTASDNEKKKLAAIMTKFYSYFDIYHEGFSEYFKKNNASCLVHPERIKYEKQQIQRKRSLSLAGLKKDLGDYFKLYDNDTIYDEYGDIKDLTEVINSVQEEKDEIRESIEDFREKYPDVTSKELESELITYKELADASLFISNYIADHTKEESEDTEDGTESESSDITDGCTE